MGRFSREKLREKPQGLGRMGSIPTVGRNYCAEKEVATANPYHLPDGPRTQYQPSSPLLGNHEAREQGYRQASRENQAHTRPLSMEIETCQTTPYFAAGTKGGC